VKGDHNYGSPGATGAACADDEFSLAVSIASAPNVAVPCVWNPLGDFSPPFFDFYELSRKYYLPIRII